MYKVADNVYGETEFYNHGDEVTVETHLYYVAYDIFVYILFHTRGVLFVTNS